MSAARVAIFLARDHILQGERSVANGWLGRADRLLAGALPLVESGWLSIGQRLRELSERWRHVSNIYLKLGLEGPAARASAATAALRHGLV